MFVISVRWYYVAKQLTRTTERYLRRYGRSVYVVCSRQCVEIKGLDPYQLTRESIKSIKEVVLDPGIYL